MKQLLRIDNYDLSLRMNGENIRVISSADLFVSEGEIVGLIGESGCGKSMLWKSLLGLADSQKWICSGDLRLMGNPMDLGDRAALTETRGNQVSVILQDPMNAFDQLFTIERHFIETARAHVQWSKGEILKKATSLMRRLYIRDPEKVLKMYPFQCSGGMLQRIMIALALMLDPPLLIADEPTTSVDVTVQREIVAMLKEINKDRNTGILYISHDLKIIEDLADRVYVMYAGYLVESFPVSALQERKVFHPYTVKLLQSRPSYTKAYLPVLEGNPPSLLDRQAGCPFAPRCPKAVDACRSYDMHVHEIGNHHTVRCLRWEDENEPAQN
jgi:oligopeptide/dipeptide ABC transporter ATP-binding protein